MENINRVSMMVIGIRQKKKRSLMRGGKDKKHPRRIKKKTPPTRKGEGTPQTR